MANDNDLRHLVAEIVAAYVQRNRISGAELPQLITAIHRALRDATAPVTPEAPVLAPAVPVRRSVQPDSITCLEDGQRFKSIRRHLRTAHGLSEAEYRAKWGLPSDYPMVAPNYSEARSAAAKRAGLGQVRVRQRQEASSQPPSSRRRMDMGEHTPGSTPDVAPPRPRGRRR